MHIPNVLPYDVVYPTPQEVLKISTRRTRTPDPSAKQTLKDLVFSSLDTDKAEDIEIIDIQNQSSLADYMVVASGRSSRQVAALADKLVERLHQAGVKDVRIEGQRQGDWVVVDAIDIIIHLFRPEVRAFYNIEKMWRAGGLLSTVTG